jgi:hypothetical protein
MQIHAWLRDNHAKQDMQGFLMFGQHREDIL